MKPSAFEYYTPRRLEECLELLVEHGDECKLLAGGQSLVPLMNLRMAAPEVVIDLNGLDGLDYVREDGGALAIGAMTRYAEVERSPLVARYLPILAHATAEVGYPAIRNRGTIGGTLAHADPVAEWPCLALALDAELVVAGPGGTRTIAADDFFTGLFATALEPTEVLTEIRFPLAGLPRPWGFVEFAKKTGDYAVVAVAVDLEVAGGAVTRARAAWSNLADRPVGSSAAEQALAGIPVAQDLAADVVARVADALAEYATDDAHAERVRLAGVLTRRAVNQALARARGAGT
jgi:carbon-monoxide dehydrogenase medium subunit